jgi:adenosylcobinamide kinase / adenosylcobinamide-phosphate guanylyltransferase
VIWFITGGARSGKSKYAQESALHLSPKPVHVATAVCNDNDHEFKERVVRHRADRDERWTNFEEPYHISRLSLENKVVVIDCVTLWLTNFFGLHKGDPNASLLALQDEIDKLLEMNAVFLIVSNEIGMGLHADTETGRKFTDLQGWANQYIASKAQKVVLMVSGIPVIIKNNES